MSPRLGRQNAHTDRAVGPVGVGGGLAPSTDRSTVTFEDYRLRLTRSLSTSSDAVITRLFAWKPRWAMIKFVNS